MCRGKELARRQKEEGAQPVCVHVKYLAELHEQTIYTEDGHGRHGPVVRLCESIGPALHTWYIRCRQQVGPKVRLGPRMPARGLPSRAVARQFAGAAPPSELGMAPLTYLLLYVTPALMLHCMLTFHVRDVESWPACQGEAMEKTNAAWGRGC